MKFIKLCLNHLFSLSFTISFCIAMTICCIFSGVKIFIIKAFYRLVLRKSFPVLIGIDALLQFHTTSHFVNLDCITSSLLMFKIKGRVRDYSKWRKEILQRMFIEPKSLHSAAVLSKFRCRVKKKYGIYVWDEDPNFSIDNHVRVWEDDYDDDTSLMNIASKILHTPLSPEHPQWAFFLVRKKLHDANNDNSNNNEDEDAIIIKVHHSLADLSVVLTMLSSFSNDDKFYHWYHKTFEYVEGKSEKSLMFLGVSPTLRYLAARKTGNCKMTPKLMISIIADVVSSTVQTIYCTSKNLLIKEHNQLNGPQLVGRKLLAVSQPLDLNILKVISKRFNCTINDIFTSCTAGAVKAIDPNICRAKSTLIIGGLKSGTFGTQNTFTTANVDLHLEDDSPLLRLQYISKELRTLKSSPLVLGTLILSFIIGYVPTFVEHLTGIAINATFGCTCCRGPDFACDAFGDTYHDIIALAMNFGPYVGISFALMSWSGGVRIGVTVDRAVAFDDSTAKTLINKTVDEIWKLHSLAVQNG